MVPTANKIKKEIIKRLPSQFDTSHNVLLDFLKSFSQDLVRAWQKWNDGMTGGFNNVTGVGIGAWVGVGTGGNLSEGSPLKIIYTWDKTTEFWETFQKELSREIQCQFTEYSTSFSFGTVSYTGTSAATPILPGPVVASSDADTLLNLKDSATSPNKIDKGVRGRLTKVFNDNPDTLDEFLKAVDGTIVQEFNLWEKSSQFSGDQFVGVGQPPLGSATGISLGTGKIS